MKKTGDVLKKDGRTAFERHKVSVEALVTTVVKLKESTREQKFTNGEGDEAVKEWADEIEQVAPQLYKTKLSPIIIQNSSNPSTKEMPVYANWQNELNKSTVI